MAEFSIGNLYDANRQIMESDKIKPMLAPAIAAAQLKIEDFFNQRCDSYAMLYCRELSDITIFHMYEKQNPNPPAVAAKECILCCTDRGELLSIEEQSIMSKFTLACINTMGIYSEEALAYYLFPYDNAVIEV